MKSKIKDIDLICFNCNKAYEIKFNNKNDNDYLFYHYELEGKYRCPECGNYIIPIDKEISEIIMKFNKLGYKTTYCCAGHVDELYNDFISKPYIAFKYDIHKFKKIRNILSYIDTKNLCSLDKDINIDKDFAIYLKDCSVIENKYDFLTTLYKLSMFII